MDFQGEKTVSMVVGQSTALVATYPICWPFSWATDEGARRSSPREGHRSGIVYVGIEANRTRGLYSASGIAQEYPPALGQIVDIYV